MNRELEAGIRLIESGMQRERAWRAQSEARVAKLRAVAELEQIEPEEAARLLAEVRAEQERAFDG